MQSGDIFAARSRLDAKLDDRVEVERRGVDDARFRRTMVEQSARDERAGVEADG